MKTRYAILSALVAATMLACAGGADQKSSSAPKPAVFIETSGAITIADAASVELTGVGAVVGAVGPFALQYSTTTGKYSGAVYLAADTYDLTLTVKKADSSVIGTATSTGVVVSGTSVKTVSFNVASINEPLPPEGFVIASSSGPGYIAADGAASAAFSITTVFAGTEPTYAWTGVKQGTTTPCDGSFSALTGSSVTFTSSATPEICTITATATAAGASGAKQSKVFTLGVGVDVSISGQFIPSPTITKLEVVDLNGGYQFPNVWENTPDSHGDPVWSLKRPNAVAACTINRTSTNNSAVETCPGAYKINTGFDIEYLATIAYPDTQAAPVVPELRIGVTYDLGGVYDISKPPKVWSTTVCSTATGAVDEFSAAVGGHKLTGGANGAFLIVFEPTAFSSGTSDLCTVTVSVDNQGAVDTFPLRLFFVQ